MPYLSIFDQKCHIWLFLGKNFKKNYYDIWNHYPWICLIAKYCEIMKIPKFGTKSALFWYFSARVLKHYCHIWNQHLRSSVIAKFCEETKMPNFGTKNTLLGYFWPKMFYLNIFGQEFQKSFRHFWNQHPQICLIAKFCEKPKITKFGTKNALFGYFMG